MPRIAGPARRAAAIAATLFVAAAFVAPPARAVTAVPQARAAVARAPRGPTWTPFADLRVRQERLVNVFHWDPDEQTRDWVRFRARAGLRVAEGPHAFELRLCDEFRQITVPDTDLNFDEIVVDRLVYTFAPGDGASVSLGRLDLIRDDGFLILEGRPGDGSRAASHDGLRVGFGEGALLEELFVVRNPKVDPIVLWSDRAGDRALRDADETGAAMRFRLPDGTGASLIFKSEEDPDGRRRDVRTWTLGIRQARAHADGRSFALEFAFQRQDLPAWKGLGEKDGWAWAMQAEAGRPLGGGVTGKAGFCLYSGENGELKDFRAPWGRWPKWSELYIYTLIPEGGVAAWANVAAPWFSLGCEFPRGVAGTFSVHRLLAPEPDWRARGTLFTTSLSFVIGGRLTGHLRWEALRPGAFHAGPAVAGEPGGDDVVVGDPPLPPLEETAHFLRWQLTYRFE